MNRKILLQIALPGVIMGTLLLGACLTSAWYIDRLQSNLTHVLSQNVNSLQAAQELEIRVRQLRFHGFLYLTDLKPERLVPMEEDHKAFKEALELAQTSASSPEGQKLVKDIQDGYQHYLTELSAAKTPQTDLGKLAKTHPILQVIDPCHKLLDLNKETITDTVRESERVTAQVHRVMLFLGVLGPLGGLVIGFVVARRLSRSIYLKMLRAEQLAAVGQLAASVAHEIRNPLTAIKMLVEAALRQNNTKPLTIPDLRVIHGEAVRLEERVQGFLNFARLPTLHRGPNDVRGIVNEAMDLIRARAGHQKVEIILNAPDHPVLASLDREQIRTVLVNLFLNALDAMPHGGRLEVSTAQTHGKITLTISDSGKGIAPEMKGRLFTPFSSSKPTGTGLGLSLSRRIVEEHGGRITAGNRVAGGACFTIELAVAPLAA